MVKVRFEGSPGGLIVSGAEDRAADLVRVAA